MFGRLYLAKDRGEAAVSADDKGRPFNAHVLFSHKAFLYPNAVVIHHFALRIGKQRKGELEFVDEFSMTGRGVGADTEEFRVVA